MPVDKEILEKLKRILSVSNSIKMEQMRDMLDLDAKTFNKQILDWAEEFGFIIDRDYIIIKKGAVDSFINQLDRQFEAWDKLKAKKVQLEPQSLKSKTKKEKIEEEERAKKIIFYKGTQLLQFEAKILQELENEFDKQFSLINEVDYSTKMGFSVENQRITKIGLNECGLWTLPELIGNLTSLKELFLGSNHLTTLPESIENLNSLKKLGLGWNDLTHLPESIGNLKSLQYLYLRGNFLTHLPESLGNLKSLIILDLSGNQLNVLPESIGKLTSLKELELGYNKLIALPESIGNLKSLKEMELDSNKLSSLPESIGNLTSLTKLYLGINKLTTLPEGIKILERRGVEIIK